MNDPSTPFLSPLHLLEPLPNSVNPVEISRAKKRWLAEFSLADATSLLLFGQHLDRNRIVQLLDSLSTDNYTHHLTLFQTTGLLNFLEHGRIDNPDSPAQLTLPPDDRPAFFEFLRPILCREFSRSLTHLLDQQKYYAANWLMNQYPLIDAKTYSPEYFRSVLLHLRGLARSIDAGEADVIRLCKNTDLADFMAGLPAYVSSSAKQVIEALIRVYETKKKHRQQELVHFIERAGYFEYVTPKDEADKAISAGRIVLIVARVALMLGVFRSCHSEFF